MPWILIVFNAGIKMKPCIAYLFEVFIFVIRQKTAEITVSNNLCIFAPTSN